MCILCLVDLRLYFDCSYFKKLSDEQSPAVVDETYKSIRDIRMQHNNFKIPDNVDNIIMKLENVYCKVFK